LADLHDLDTQGNAASKVIDIEEELIDIVCPPWFTMLSGYLLTILIRVAALREIMSMSCSSPARSTHTVQAQSMSGIGVGSKEMRSALVDNGELQPLHLMLNDLKTKVGYVTSYHNLL
jgi:hypothetical protein